MSNIQTSGNERLNSQLNRTEQVEANDLRTAMLDESGGFLEYLDRLSHPGSAKEQGLIYTT